MKSAVEDMPWLEQYVEKFMAEQKALGHCSACIANATCQITGTGFLRGRAAVIDNLRQAAEALRAKGPCRP